jgi:flagellar protein FliO/FliZ
MLQAAAGMLLVLGLIFFCAWLARRFGLQRLGGSGLVKIVSSAPVGTRERVVVVEVAGTWLVLGVTASQVNTLHSLPVQPGSPGDYPTAEDPQSRMMALFSSKLRAAAGGKALGR